MPRPAGVIAREVGARARGIDAYLERIEGLRRRGTLTPTDTERAYAGAFLEFHAYAERSIERLFIGLLRGRLSSNVPGVRPLITVNSDRVAHNVVSSERRYADWLPYDRFTVPRALAFFSGGRPFTSIPKSHQRAFEDLATIRNALAHQSSSSLRRFRRRFVDGQSLPKSQTRPSGYLRGMHTIGQTRMNYLLTMTSVVMNDLCG